MNIGYHELCSTEFTFSDIFAYRISGTSKLFSDYETAGRTKHLLYCQLENRRSYYVGMQHIYTMSPGDILFLPHGTTYHSFSEDETLPSQGIGISFYLLDSDNSPILFDEKIRVFESKEYLPLQKRFEKILFSVMNPAENVLRLKGELFSLMDELFANKKQRKEFHARFDDIMEAVRILENHPERNDSVRQLASLCLMSESSFARKFKDYSGGVSPIEYRNRIRLMLADELASTSLSVNEIAEKLGFYDASHLCKLYKKSKGHSLKLRS